MRVTASTPFYAVLGHPVAQSMSPILQNGWIDEHDFDGVYVALNIKEPHFESALFGLHQSGLKGANVTTPYKERAAKSATCLSERAHVVQSVNCLTAQSIGFIGDSTDGDGFIADLDARVPHWRAHEGHIVLLGAGGAARAILLALQKETEAQIIVVNRSHDRAVEAVAMLPPQQCCVKSWSQLPSALTGAVLVINATSAGFKGQNPLELDFSKTHRNCLVYDSVYAPRETAFLQAAKRDKRQSLDGLGMLVGQGALAFETWFGVRPNHMSGLARLEAVLSS